MSTPPFFDSRITVLDGGMGSSLMAQGLPQGECPERWLFDQPEAVVAVHRNFVIAGARVIQTNTFGGTRLRLRRHGLADRMRELNGRAVQLARQAIDTSGVNASVCIAGNLGPTGLMLPPAGRADREEIRDAFAEQAMALSEAGADYLSIETMTDLNEALAALEGARLGSSLPATVCMSFDEKKRGFFTLMGDTPQQVCDRLRQAGATAVGANCSTTSDAMHRLISLLVQSSGGLPIIAKPNAGLPRIVDACPVYDQEPATFAAQMLAMARAGAHALGGCCGTAPQHIAALCQVLASEGAELCTLAGKSSS